MTINEDDGVPSDASALALVSPTRLVKMLEPSSGTTFDHLGLPPTEFTVEENERSLHWDLPCPHTPCMAYLHTWEWFWGSM